jgi:CRISPR/Cas system-associated endoribonuclease Cas2
MLKNMSLKMKFLINTLITVLMLFVILGLSYFSGNKTASNLETLEKVYISGMVKAIKATDGYTYFQNSVYAGTVTDFSNEEEFETLLKEVEKEGNKSLKEFEVLSKDLSSLGNKEINSLIKKTMILQKSSISNGISVI